jgi:DNA processing protein
MTSLEAYLTLNLLPGIGPVRVRRLTDHFGSAEAIFAATDRELQFVEGIGPEAARSIRSGSDGALGAKELAKATEMGVTVLAFDDSRYPSALREIYDPPLVLYVRGKVPERWARGVGLVGSRLTTHYGTETAKKLGYQLAYAGVPVVSGLARGIDTAAHMGALAAKGPTWAVLGTGVDVIYPPENAELAAKIAETGCVISEFPLGTKPERQNFPMRNRIVSGLSFGVLVIEAGLESGALITARQALEQGRQVFAVPGRIDTPHAKGCHKLIRDGAKLVEEVSDILGEIDFLLPRSAAESRPEVRSAPPELSDDEKALFAALGDDETSIDALIAKSGLPSGKVSSTLLRLEMKKLVRQLPGKVFVRTA